MKKFILLEWVGRWTIASYSEECSGLFEWEEEAWDWVDRHYLRDYYSEDEYHAEVRSRFVLREISVPDGAPEGWEQ